MFLRNKAVALFQQLDGTEKGKWGKMSPWHAVEHLAHIFDASSNTVQYEIVTPADALPKYYAFLLSEKEFFENTKAPLSIMGEEPAPLKTSSYIEAVQLFENAMMGFFNFFRDNPSAETIHPVFGKLNFNDWLKLHGKHVRHHLRQFGLLEK